MAHSAGVTWTCDRCRKSVVMPDDKEIPAGWRGITARDFEQDPDREWEICGACYSQMERLLMNVEQPE